MRVLVQKCQNASVLVEGEEISHIDLGLMLLVSFTEGDCLETIRWMVNKIVHLRIFEDQYEVMNLSVKEIGGSALSVSQFTLYGNATKGNRPSYQAALPGSLAKPLYEKFNEELAKEIPVSVGAFGEFMEVRFTNLGPTTIWLER